MPHLSKGKARKLERIAALQAHKAITAKRRDAAGKRDLLDNYAAFRTYSRQGVQAKLEGLQGVALSEMDVDACLDLQRVNLGDAADGWDEEAARAALRHEESRVILMRGPTPAAEEAGEGGVEGTGGGDEFDAADEWDFVPEWQPSKMPGIFDVSRVKEEDEGEAAQTEAVDVSDGPEAEVPPLLAYLHLQFCLESGKPPLSASSMYAAHRHSTRHLHTCTPSGPAAKARRASRPFLFADRLCVVLFMRVRRCRWRPRRWAAASASLAFSSSS